MKLGLIGIKEGRVGGGIKLSITRIREGSALLSITGGGDRDNIKGRIEKDCSRIVFFTLDFSLIVLVDEYNTCICTLSSFLLISKYSRLYFSESIVTTLSSISFNRYWSHLYLMI